MYKLSACFEELSTSTYCAWLGTDPVIITIDPEIIKTIATSSEFYNKAEIIYNPLNNAIRDGIITSEGNIDNLTLGKYIFILMNTLGHVTPRRTAYKPTLIQYNIDLCI